MWTPWVGHKHYTGEDGFVERELPDGRKVMVPYYTDGPTLHRILKPTLAGRYGESRSYEAGEFVYLSEGLSRLLVKRGFAEPCTIR